MEDCEEHSLYVYPQQTRKIEEVREGGYAYFSENDLLLAKLGGCFENRKMSITKNLVNGVGFGSTEFIVLRTGEEVMIEWVYFCLQNSNFFQEGKDTMKGTTLQRISLDFLNNYLIPLPPIEVQKNFIEELKRDEKDKQNLKTFISNQNDKKARILKTLWEKVDN